MNATVKSTIIALAFVTTLSRFAPVQAQEVTSAVLSKTPVTLQSSSVLARIHPVNMRVRPVVQRIRPAVQRLRPVMMQSGRTVYLSLPQQAQISKRFIAY